MQSRDGFLDFSELLGAFGRSGKKSARKTAITNINIRYLGDVHGMDGMQVDNEIFEIKIPFQNKTGSDLLADNIKRPDLRIEAIKVNEPFELLGAVPELPVSVGYQKSVEIRLRIRAPSIPYSGPLSVELGEKAGSTVRVQIEKIVGIAANKRVELEDAPSVLSVRKGQILKRDVQLYKLLKYGDEVRDIEVSAPFKVSGSEPRVPFSIDKASSYILSVYVLAPDFDYAGPLELTFL